MKHNERNILLFVDDQWTARDSRLSGRNVSAQSCWFSALCSPPLTAGFSLLRMSHTIPYHAVHAAGT